MTRKFPGRNDREDFKAKCSQCGTEKGKVGFRFFRRRGLQVCDECHKKA